MEERRYDRSISPEPSIINELFFAALDGPMMADPRLVRDIIMRKTKVRYNEPSNTPVCERCRHLHVETHDDMICPKCEAEDRLHEELGKIGKKVSLPREFSSPKPWQVHFNEETQRWILSTPEDFEIRSAEDARRFADQLAQSVNAGQADSRTIELTVEPPVTPEHVQVSLDLPAPDGSIDRATLERAFSAMANQVYRPSIPHPAVVRDLERLQHMEEAMREMALNHQVPYRFASVPGQAMADAMNRDRARESTRQTDPVRGATANLLVIDDLDDDDED